MQKSATKRGPRSENVLPRVAPGLQNETLEPPKFIKNSDLDPPGCQEVAPQASEVPPDPKFNENHQKYDQHLTENVQKTVAEQCKVTFKHVVGMHLELHYYILAACLAKLNSKVQ